MRTRVLVCWHFADKKKKRDGGTPDKSSSVLETEEDASLKVLSGEDILALKITAEDLAKVRNIVGGREGAAFVFYKKKWTSSDCFLFHERTIVYLVLAPPYGWNWREFKRTTAAECASQETETACWREETKFVISFIYLHQPRQPGQDPTPPAPF